MKEHPILFSGEMVRAIIEGRKTQTRRVIKPQPADIANRSSALVNEAWQSGFIEVRCPYGKPGDHLWVRETFTTAGGNRVLYYATDDVNDLRKKKPAIHMPRSYSRIDLEILKVRVERIQDISESDAIAEGCASAPFPARNDFAELWEELNAKRGYGWHVNPWVWVIEFRRVTNRADHANQAPILPGVLESGTRE